MPAQTIPGFTGFQYARFSSNNKRAIGKFTDVNHLMSIQHTDPADYDKKLIDIYTQSSLYSNDFLDMINRSNPYYIDRGDSFKWNIRVPFLNAKIVEVPDATVALSKPGIDGQEFSLVLDTNEFGKNETVIIGHRQFGPQLAVVSDPLPHGRAFLYTFTLVSDRPGVDFVERQFLQAGVEVLCGTSVIGEFDIDLPGLGRLNDTIELFESLSSATGRSHKITKWADEMQISQRDGMGNLLDMIAYFPKYGDGRKLTPGDARWEPFIETLLRQKMLDDKTHKFIWNKAGTVRTNGSRQEYKHLSDGVYQRMRKHGNYVPVDRGDLSTNLIRTVFSDLFYRRVDMPKRRVKLFTNEAGFDTFDQMIKADAQGSGLSLVADSGSRYIQGEGQHLIYNWAFDSMITRETGKVELVHLKELDQPQTNLEYGQNKKSTPLYMVFNVSPDSDGSFQGNMREVRLKGAPNMTWGYVDGRIHHLGHAASRGMSSGNMDPWYTVWYEDRSDVFVEDLSRTVLIEELPQY